MATSTRVMSDVSGCRNLGLGAPVEGQCCRVFVAQRSAGDNGRADVTFPWLPYGFRAPGLQGSAEAGQERGDRGSGTAAGVARLDCSFAARINLGLLDARRVRLQRSREPSHTQSRSCNARGGELGSTHARSLRRQSWAPAGRSHCVSDRGLRPRELARVRLEALRLPQVRPRPRIMLPATEPAPVPLPTCHRRPAAYCSWSPCTICRYGRPQSRNIAFSPAVILTSPGEPTASRPWHWRAA